MKEIKQKNFLDGSGFVTLVRKNAMAVFRYPCFKFRPSQSDLLHVDFWLRGENILRDAGTYSYASAGAIDYFSGTQSHNTIQFDDRDQMPRLGRFLFGDWLKTEAIEPLCLERSTISFAASYRDKHKVFHRRKLILSDEKLIVIDKFYGFQHKAVLRWRLKNVVWSLSDNELTSSLGKIMVSATVPMIRKELCIGMESRYYLQKNEIPVFEVEVREAGEITTEYAWCV